MAIASNITRDKIKNGEVILGITGNYTGLDTSDATAVNSDILENKTAYVNGAKVTGIVKDLKSVGVGLTNRSMYDVNNMLHISLQANELALINEGTSFQTDLQYYEITNRYNIIPERIKKDEVILGVTGTYNGSGGGADLNDYFAPNLDDSDLSYACWHPQSMIKSFPSNMVLHKPQYLEGLFYEFSNLEKLPILNFTNMDGTSTMANAFYDCAKLTNVPVFDYSSVNDCSNTFACCTNLTSVEGIGELKPLYPRAMFYDCKNLEYINISINLSNVYTWDDCCLQMFGGCYKLKKSPIVNWGTRNIDIRYCFERCKNIEEIDLRTMVAYSNMRGTNSFLYGINNDCHIIVKNNSMKNWLSNLYPNLTNIDIV